MSGAKDYHEVLLPVCKEALKHRAHWQRQAREAVEAVRQYADDVKHSRPIQRGPLPYMEHGNRLPDVCDNPWRYLILGRKLEQIFGFRGFLIPTDLSLAMHDLYPHLKTPLFDYVNRALDLCDFQIQWEILKDDLPSTEDLDVGDDLNQTQPSDNPQIQSAMNTPGNNNTQQKNADPGNGEKKRLSEIEKKSRIVAELVKNSDATATEIAKATGIHRTAVSKLWGPLKNIAREKRRSKPTGHFTTSGNPEAIDPASFCMYCKEPLLGSWWCLTCEENVIGECKTCHFTQNHPNEAVP